MPQLIAHRGANREAPENTMPAFRRALELGADGIELDVMLTSDLGPVVTHNDDLSILTDRRGYVRNTPAEVVQSLDVGERSGFERGSATMPSLVQVLELMSPLSKLTIIEIKAQPGMAAKAARIIGGVASTFKMKGELILSSFSPKVLHELKNHYPELPRALIFAPRAFSFFRSVIFAKLLSLKGVHPALGAMTPKRVASWKKRGLVVRGWCANVTRDFDLCVDCSLDGIVTDDIRGARQYLAENLKR